VLDHVFYMPMPYTVHNQQFQGTNGCNLQNLTNKPVNQSMTTQIIYHHTLCPKQRQPY